MASSQPPKQDKKRQTAINAYDKIGEEIKLHLANALTGVVTAVVFAIIQWVFNAAYGQALWAGSPTVGVLYGCIRFAYEMRQVQKKRQLRYVLGYVWGFLPRK